MWQDFANTLNELNKTYKTLIELGKKKHQALVLVDMKTVEALLPQEELTATIAQLEKNRQNVLLKLAATSEKLGPESKMTDILKLAPAGKMQELLQKLYTMLQVTVQEARELSENNAVLIRAAMSAAAYHLNRIGGATVEPAYGKGGEVVSHRKNFDYNA